ncbi:hypothetical protein LB456_00700 [Psychroflexus sp. CAK57W]|uniref:hypothetical protein n=1 Tax=Psychroflexus curvus TaxID=2873595 RepID=UPI001CCAB96B|nr:hypothetical protein [Psychroflexus curvus]MBZ9627477.1 hypothetical protein [Psychroflexus curvus]MBZ9785963.1 hypothetical protein [Psychroflexus curvus]
MKKISLLLALIFVMVSCEGERGPVGPVGPMGETGDALLGTILEIEGDFTAENGYSFLYEFPPSEVEVFESDVVQVYLLEEVIQDNGESVDVWTPLPNSFFFDGGNQLVYNYNHTYFDVNIFLDGNVDFRSFTDAEANAYLFNQVFRIAIIPAAYAENNPDLNSYEALMQAMPDAKVLKVK